MNENLSFTNDFQSICALIIHLGTHEKWQSRTAREIAGSLAMDREEVERILLTYPCFFRESTNRKEGQRLFTVHLRYTRRKKDPITGEHIAEPLTAEEIGILINILMQMVSIEKQESQFFTELKESNKKNNQTTFIAILVACISALTTLISAVLK